jgi:asparagine synthase (glutamine-hydrolysing)
MTLLVASPGLDSAAFARGVAAIENASPGGLARVEKLPAGWQCAIARFATDACIEDDLIVLVSGTPRRAEVAGEPAVTRPVSAREIAAAWRSGGLASLATLSADFAVVVIEPRSGAIHGLVDPLGHSSLYLSQGKDAAVVCTEPRPLLAVRSEASIDPAALQDVVNLRFLSGRRTLWKGVRQLLPGILVTIDGSGEPRETEVRRIRFRPAAESGDFSSAVDHVHAMFKAEFARRRDEGMDHVAIPLSGGVDSSILACLAARVFPHVTAFTASIDGYENPELPRACEVACRLGIAHRIVNIVNDDVASLYPLVIERLQEPPRHFNNMIIARLMETISRDCAWVIGGDTAGELFGNVGLHTVHQLARKRGLLGVLPRPMQRALARGLQWVPGRRPASLARIAASTFDELMQVTEVIPRSRQAEEHFRSLVDDRRPSRELVTTHYETGHGPYDAHQTWDLRTFQITAHRRNERLSRAHGLRYWYPFADAGMVDFTTRMPSAFKYDVNRGQSKPILHALCDRLLGQDVSAWSKLGFPSPEREWMTGPLAASLQACTADDALISSLIDPGDVRRIDIRRDHQTLWTLMTLETVLQQARAATAGR